MAVNRVDLTIEKGQFVTVIGSNGAGKSTLLNLIGGRYLARPGQDQPERRGHHPLERAPPGGVHRPGVSRSAARDRCLDDDRGKPEHGRIPGPAARPGARRHAGPAASRYRELLAQLGLGLENRLQQRGGAAVRRSAPVAFAHHGHHDAAVFAVAWTSIRRRWTRRRRSRCCS